MHRIHNVHARTIASPASVVGDVLATLGSPGDRLWATDIWAAEPVILDRPLGVGATGGHGSIRYSVVEYEPGRRVVFAFAPGGGLSGTHRFELEALGAERCRLTHVLEAQTQPWMRPVVPILIGWHDAMVETALDRVEREATGRLCAADADPALAPDRERGRDRVRSRAWEASRPAGVGLTGWPVRSRAPPRRGCGRLPRAPQAGGLGGLRQQPGVVAAAAAGTRTPAIAARPANANCDARRLAFERVDELRRDRL